MYLISINLSFFADDTGKTEQPTARKKEKAREEGQVAKSPEIALAFMLIFVFSTLRLFAKSIYTKTQELFYFNLGFIPDVNIYDITDPQYTSKLINHSFINVIIIVAPIFIVAMIVGIVTNLIQVRWHPTTKPLKPKLSKLNPINGIKRLFKITQLFELFKSIIKFAVILTVLYMIMEDEIDNLPGLYELSLINAVMYIGDLLVNLGINVGIIYIFLAFVDYIFTRYQHIKSLKMTKHEVKDEHKEIEGDPQIKGKIRQKMREISMRRMMQELPKADVIITNPTHYAVALGYERNADKAPIVIAKGVDYVAKRIREFGIEHDITIVENRQLARTLYQVVDIGQEIPPDLYQAVAEVLAYVFRLKNKVS